MKRPAIGNRLDAVEIELFQKSPRPLARLSGVRVEVARCFSPRLGAFIAAIRVAG